MKTYKGFAGQTVTEVEYKFYYITHNFYNNGMYEVQFCGDEIAFPTEAEARAFIDEISD